MFIITARDIIYREDKEVMEVLTKEEAQQWAKQFREEYPKGDGYKVTVKEA